MIDHIPSRHVVRITDVAYPLDLSDGTITGYANERTVQIYGSLGYSVDLVATLQQGQHGAEQKARLMAAALSGCSPDEIEIDHRYWYRAGRNASTPTATGVRFTPACRVSSREHSTIIYNQGGDLPETIVTELRRVFSMPHQMTQAALLEQSGEED